MELFLLINNHQAVKMNRIEIHIILHLVSWRPLVEDDQKTPFSIATTPRYRGRVLLLSLDCAILPLIRTLYCRVLSKEGSSTIFKVFGMMRPGIEPQVSRIIGEHYPLGQTHTYIYIYIWIWIVYLYYTITSVFNSTKDMLSIFTNPSARAGYDIRSNF